MAQRKPQGCCGLIWRPRRCGSSGRAANQHRQCQHHQDQRHKSPSVEYGDRDCLRQEVVVDDGAGGISGAQRHIATAVRPDRVSVKFSSFSLSASSMRLTLTVWLAVLFAGKVTTASTMGVKSTAVALPKALFSSRPTPDCTGLLSKINWTGRSRRAVSAFVRQVSRPEAAALCGERKGLSRRVCVFSLKAELRVSRTPE